MKEKTKLRPLDGIRALATIGIFLFHSGFLINGTFPVTLFFMLSGFMMFYTKSNSIPCSWQVWINTYVKRKLRSFYPIHIVSFFASCIVGAVWLNPVKESVIGGILDLLLIHPFFPKYALIYNGVAWYLAVTIFLYIIAWPLLIYVKSIRNIKGVTSLTLSMIVSINLICRFGGPLYLYTNPVYRVLDFLLGMLIAKAYLDDIYEIKNPVCAEIMLVIVFLVQYVVGLYINPNPGYYSLLFTVALYIFSKGKGAISNLLSLPIFGIISKYSFDFLWCMS